MNYFLSKDVTKRHAKCCFLVPHGCIGKTAVSWWTLWNYFSCTFSLPFSKIDENLCHDFRNADVGDKNQILRQLQLWQATSVLLTSSLFVFNCVFQFFSYSLGSTTFLHFSVSFMILLRPFQAISFISSFYAKGTYDLVPDHCLQEFWYFSIIYSNL